MSPLSGQSSQKTVTRYAAGARGTDARYVTPPQQSETAAYPLYDAHGNAIAEVQKTASSPWFQLGNRRKYDAWGPVRWSQGSPPDQGYCANLGHRQDAESGLVYMRARYYDPGTGRFLSEDPARDGANWYIYCGNDPVKYKDPTGKFIEILLAAAFEDWLQTVKGGSEVAAKNWAKGRVEEIAAKHSGKILGHLMAETIDDLTYGVTEKGFFFRNPNGGKGIQVHFKLIEGKISFQSPGLQKGTIAYEFFEGFKEGLIEGL